MGRRRDPSGVLAMSVPGYSGATARDFHPASPGPDRFLFVAKTLLRSARDRQVDIESRAVVRLPLLGSRALRAKREEP